MNPKIEHTGNGIWLATGPGYDRFILAEGFTREHAWDAWLKVYSKQYEEAQRLDNLTINGKQT